MKFQQANIAQKILFCLILFFLGLMSASITHADTYNLVTKWGSEGSGNGQFYDPCGVAVDSSDNVYVAEVGNGRIQKFNSTGGYLDKWGSNGSSDGQFYYPYDVAVDSSGKVYVADTGNNRIQVFALSTDTITTLTSSPNPSVFGQSVTFTAEISRASAGAGTPSGSVTFKDGTTDLGSTNTTSGKAAFTTSSLSAGKHSITAVYNGDILFNSSTSPILVQNVTEQTPVFPTADFSMNYNGSYAPLSVQFTDLSKNAVSYNWNFGDGNTSENMNPANTYYVAGNYTVTLNVSNANGTDSKNAVMTVLQKQDINISNVLPVADFSMSATGGYAPLSIVFIDCSQNATSRNWDVNGDGTEDSNASRFVYKYASAGTYIAKLTAINANGTDTKNVTIIVEKEKEESSDVSGSGGGGGG